MEVELGLKLGRHGLQHRQLKNVSTSFIRFFSGAWRQHFSLACSNRRLGLSVCVVGITLEKLPYATIKEQFGSKRNNLNQPKNYGSSSI